MSISVITTNVFAGHGHVAAIIENLGLQTCQGFEWIFVDAYYETNRQLVEELAKVHGLSRVVHVPFRGATHVGRKYHWECYNDAVLLAGNDLFIRAGVYRFFHNRVVELAAEHGSNQTWLSLRQQDIRDFCYALPYEQQIEKYRMEVDTTESWSQMVSQCGMFSFSRQQMIEINGNNEALLIHHWEDADLNSRWTHLGKVNLLGIQNAMLRIYHNKSNPYVGKEVCPQSPACIFWAQNNHELERYAPAETEWIDYKGFPWARCKQCGTLAVSFCDKYFDYLKQEPRALIAPIGVGGVGRNLRSVQEDLGRLNSLSSKVDLLTASHTEPKYLRE